MHGFRQPSGLASECTDAPHAVMELSLAHAVGSSVEQAYARSDLIGKRRRCCRDGRTSSPRMAPGWCVSMHELRTAERRLPPRSEFTGVPMTKSDGSMSWNGC